MRLDFARRVNAYRSGVSPTRNTKEGKSLNNAAALCSGAILLATHRHTASPARRVATRRVHVAVNPTVRETTPKHEITLRNAVVGLQLFCFKDPRRVCLRETVYIHVRRLSASLRLVSRGTKGALFRGM